MNTFLVTWNPKKFPWKRLKLAGELARKGGAPVFANWTFGRSSKPRPGDRVFLIKVGQEPRGLIGSGKIVSRPESGPHHSDPRRGPQMYARIRWDYVVNGSKKAVVIARSKLDGAPFRKQRWSNQNPAILIKPEVAAALERLWAETIGTATGARIGEEALGDAVHVEGGRLQIYVNRFERDRQAREQCIDHFGCKCSVCEIALETVYGAVAADFIHVHHIQSLATTGETTVHPKKDLRPVCPNCHAILHRRNPPFSIQTVRSFIKTASLKAARRRHRLVARG